MARISAYKFVSPIAGGGVKSPTVAAASQNLVALNNVGFSLTGIAGTVKDLHRISFCVKKNSTLDNTYKLYHTFQSIFENK